MIRCRRAVLLVSLFVASSAFAAWNPQFSSTYVELTVGETTKVQLSAGTSGFSYNPEFERWTCVSSRKSVAHVEGSLRNPRGVANVRITAIAPGVAWVRIKEISWRYVQIVVHPRPVSVSIVPSTSVGNVGQSVTLTAITEGSPHTLLWYLGHIGDVSHPLEGSGNDLTVTPDKPGVTYYWVSAIGAQGASSAEIAIDVKAAPRRRAVGRR
jgi:hypothetical protein